MSHPTLTRPTRRTFLALGAVPVATCLTPELALGAVGASASVRLGYVRGSDSWEAQSPPLVRLMRQGLLPEGALVAPPRHRAGASHPETLRLSVRPLVLPDGQAGLSSVELALESPFHGVPFSVFSFRRGGLDPCSSPTSVSAPVHAERGAPLTLRVDDEAPVPVGFGPGGAAIARGAWVLQARSGGGALTLAIWLEDRGDAHEVLV